jgi:nicotinamidase-related amidase
MVDVQERLLPAVQEPQEVLRNGALLLRAAGEMAIPVVVSEQYPKGLGPTVPELAALAGSNRAYDKVEFSCFANLALREALGAPGRQTVIFGIEAHVCVLQTALEMTAAGADVAVVADAVSSRGQQNRDLALRRMERQGVRILSTEMVLFEWLRAAGSEAFRKISKLIR